MIEAINTINSNTGSGISCNTNHPWAIHADKSFEAERDIEISREDMDRTAQVLKKYIESNEISLDISVDKETGMIAIKIISEKDGSVIREIPSEEIIEHAASMKRLEGILFERTI
jgi:flagellar protein FlaG